MIKYGAIEQTYNKLKVIRTKHEFDSLQERDNFVKQCKERKHYSEKYEVDYEYPSIV